MYRSICKIIIGIKIFFFCIFLFFIVTILFIKSPMIVGFFVTILIFLSFSLSKKFNCILQNDIFLQIKLTHRISSVSISKFDIFLL